MNQVELMPSRDGKAIRQVMNCLGRILPLIGEIFLCGSRPSHSFVITKYKKFINPFTKPIQAVLFLELH